MDGAYAGKTRGNKRRGGDYVSSTNLFEAPGWEAEFRIDTPVRSQAVRGLVEASMQEVKDGHSILVALLPPLLWLEWSPRSSGINKRRI